MTAPVYLSINEFPGDGVTTQFEFNFAGGYISREHVKAYTTDAAGVITPVTITTGMWVNDYTIDIGVSAPVGGKVRIYRDTPRSEPLVNFEDGARITEANLDLLARQTVLAVAEAFDAGAYATVNDLLGAAGAALASAEQAETNAAASEAAAAASAIAASAARIAAELAETNAEAAANDPRVQAVNDNISDIQTCATNIAAILAAPGAASAAATSAAAAESSAAAAATFDPALFVPKAGSVTMTGPLSVPAGASGAQVPQAQEIAGLVRAMAVGTVSQSGGVPTGAIIERGSNANGEYIRFADGTQICTATLTMNAAGSPVGGIYISGNVTWTFPAVFAAAPSVSGLPNSPSFWTTAGASTGPSSSDVRVALPATFTAGVLVRATAIGRWF